LLLPTRYDAFANVCLEAAACGLAVVTSGANGCAELLAHAGLVVEDPEDAAGFGAALERLADPSLRAELGGAGRQLAEAHSWPTHVDTLRALYRRIGTGVRDGSS
jgi:UDP-glucose:(heptosyl)LPS alpha-1,3-glucosyltransferase